MAVVEIQIHRGVTGDMSTRNEYVKLVGYALRMQIAQYCVEVNWSLVLGTIYGHGVAGITPVIYQVNVNPSIIKHGQLFH